MMTTRMLNAAAFPTRLTDEQWAILEPFVPANKPSGRPPKYRRRDLLDAIIYAV
jgi:putative transposase